MPEYLSPGVYVEVSEPSKTAIEGISTSTVGMVGATEYGPLNEPTLITSFPEFKRVFGGYLDQSYGEYRYLPHAIEGFFRNGGKRIYVNRIDIEESVVCSDRNNLVRRDGAKLVSDEAIIGKEFVTPKTGLCAFKDIDEINVIAIPNGTTPKIQHAMIEHCEEMKNRFAVLDPVKCSDLEAIQKQRSSMPDSRYAALYYPWIHIRSCFSGEVMSVPPSGHICGIYARTDATRGVHKAPANEIIKGAVGLARKISKNEQSILNPLGINCLREFAGRGIRVWGARTMASDPNWKYISVSRLLIYLEQSIKKGTQWVVFEPNDEKLWVRVRQIVNQFLTGEWKEGALMGTSPEEAFFVKCGRDTMTQNDIDNGRFTVLVGVAPIRPAEFIIFRIAHWRGEPVISE